MTPAGELAALGAFYGIAVADALAYHGAALERYCEWVVGRDAFAVVTLGALADGSLAARAAAHWPAAILHSAWWSRTPFTDPYRRMLRQMTVLTVAQLAWALGLCL